MIARIWSARTTSGRAPEYAEYLRAHVFTGLHAVEGYERAILLQRPSGGFGTRPATDSVDVVEIQVITFWRSLDAIRAFSGPDLEAAVVTEQAAAMLLDYDRRVRHYELVISDW